MPYMAVLQKCEGGAARGLLETDEHTAEAIAVSSNGVLLKQSLDTHSEQQPYMVTPNQQPCMQQQQQPYAAAAGQVP